MASIAQPIQNRSGRRALQPSHDYANVPINGINNQVDVIGHDHVSDQFENAMLARLCQCIDEELARHLASKDFNPVEANSRSVMECIWLVRLEELHCNRRATPASKRQSVFSSYEFFRTPTAILPTSTSHRPLE